MSTLGLGIIGLGVGKGALPLNQKSDSPIKVWRGGGQRFSTPKTCA